MPNDEIVSCECKPYIVFSARWLRECGARGVTCKDCSWEYILPEYREDTERFGW